MYSLLISLLCACLFGFKNPRSIFCATLTYETSLSGIELFRQPHAPSTHHSLPLVSPDQSDSPLLLRRRRDSRMQIPMCWRRFFRTIESGDDHYRFLRLRKGLENPAPIIQTFYAEDQLFNDVKLDGVVTLVDAKHANIHLDDVKPGVVNEAVEQIAYADRIIVNKNNYDVVRVVSKVSLKFAWLLGAVSHHSFDGREFLIQTNFQKRLMLANRMMMPTQLQLTKLRLINS